MMMTIMSLLGSAGAGELGLGKIGLGKLVSAKVNR